MLAEPLDWRFSGQCLWAELHDTVDELRQTVAGFVETHTQWADRSARPPHPKKEAYQDAITTAAA